MPFLISPITSNTLLLAAVVVAVLLVCAQSELLYIMHNIAALHVIPACDTAAPLSNQLQQNLPNSFTVSKIYNYGGLGCSVVQWLHPGIDRPYALLSYVTR